MFRKMLFGIVAVGIAASTWAEKENLLANPEFEAPEDGGGQMPFAWEYYTSRRPSAHILEGEGKKGSQCLMLAAQQAPNVGQGFTQTIDVEPGERYDFEAYVKNYGKDPLNGSAFGQLVIEWLSPSGREGDRTTSEPWDRSLSRTGWKKMYIRKVEAPEYAAQAKFGIHLFDGDGGAEGAFLVDDVRVRKR